MALDGDEVDDDDDRDMFCIPPTLWVNGCERCILSVQIRLPFCPNPSAMIPKGPGPVRRRRPQRLALELLKGDGLGPTAVLARDHAPSVAIKAQVDAHNEQRCLHLLYRR